MVSGKESNTKKLLQTSAADLVLVSGCFPALEAGEDQFRQRRKAIMAFVPKALTGLETPVVSLDGEAETGQSVI